MDERIDRLLAVVEAQQLAIADQAKQIAAQGEHIGLLVQSVVMLLGEETGAPLESDSTTDPERTDLDGNSY